MPAKDYSQRKYFKAPFFAKPGELGELFGYANFEIGASVDSDFAIVDLETSSLSPNSGYIVEIAIVKMNRKGKILERFETLINPPDGNVGRSDIHLISASSVKNAPRFPDVIGNILSIMDECVVVAHNAKFEENFLASEFARAGCDTPLLPAIDTMWLAQMELDLYNYKLPTVLSYYGHSIIDAHTAMGDVLSIAKFLPKILDEVPRLKYPVNLENLPKIVASGKLKPR